MHINMFYSWPFGAESDHHLFVVCRQRGRACQEEVAISQVVWWHWENRKTWIIHAIQKKKKKNGGSERVKVNLAPFFQSPTACTVLFLSAFLFFPFFFFNQTIIGRLERNSDEMFLIQAVLDRRAWNSGTRFPASQQAPMRRPFSSRAPFAQKNVANTQACECN